MTWPHFASRRTTGDRTINVQRERPGDPRIAPTRTRTCRRPDRLPATAGGRASPCASLPQMVQEVIGQGDPNLRICVRRSEECDQCGCVGVMSVVHSLSLQRPNLRGAGNGSIRDSHTSVRPDQVAIDPCEAQPSGKSHLPVVGVPGFPGFDPWSFGCGGRPRSSLPEHGW